MVRFTTSDLSRKSGDIIAAALREPIMITRRSKPLLVLLDIDRYRLLAAHARTRRTGTLDTMSNNDFADFRRAIETYAASSDED